MNQILIHKESVISNDEPQLFVDDACKTKIELRVPVSFKGRLALEALGAAERLRSKLIN